MGWKNGCHKTRPLGPVSFLVSLSLPSLLCSSLSGFLDAPPTYQVSSLLSACYPLSVFALSLPSAWNLTPRPTARCLHGFHSLVRSVSNASILMMSSLTAILKIGSHPCITSTPHSFFSSAFNTFKYTNILYRLLVYIAYGHLTPTPPYLLNRPPECKLHERRLVYTWFLYLDSR